MPNYGNKMTLAAADEPPYLTVGTDVSAKYKGAFCEAKIIEVNKHVKLRVLFDGHPGSYMIDDTELKQGSPLEIGSKIEARHPEKKQQIYINATIQKILDQSRYTVVFDDGDQCILRRNSICLKSGKHFAESETLDQLPLTNPEHFGNPVKVGQASLEQNNHINSTNHNLQQVANHSTSKLSNNITNNNNNSSASNSGNGKNGYADFNNQSSSTTDKNGKTQNNIKLETEKPSKGKSISSPSNTNSTSTTSTSAAGPPGRRGGAKGRKRRESTSASSKQAPELDDEPGDDSQDSADIDPTESDVDFASVAIGVKLMVQYGKGKVQNVYEAKVNKVETNSSGRTRYFVHYTGWNNRYDEWITKSRILSIVTDKDGFAKDTRLKQAEPNSITANSNQISSSDVTVKSEPVVPKDKEKDKDVKQPAKAARRSRHLDAASSPAAVPNHISGSEPPASNLTSTVTSNKQGVSATPSREKDRDREREKDKDKEKDREREKEIPSKTRRTRLPADNATSASSTDSSASTSEPKASIKHAEDTKEKEKDRVRDKEKGKDKDKERIKQKETVASPVTRPGRPRLTDAISTAQSSEKVQATSLKEREKEPPTKTRRSRHVDASSSANATPANSSASSTASSTPPRSEISNIDRDKPKDLEKEAHHSSKEGRSTRQVDSTFQANHKSNNSSTSMKDRDSDKDLNTPAKTRASKQTDTRHTTSSSSLSSTTVSSSLSLSSTTVSSSSLSSVSTAATTTSSIATTSSSTSTTSSTTTTSDTIPLSTPSVTGKDREKEREKERERDRDRDKEPPTKIRRSRQSTQEAAGNVSSKDTSATTSNNATTNNATTTTITTSTASSTSSNASSSSSSSCSMALPNSALSALVSLSEREREKFDDALIIDEPDCDKRISILQDKIMTIRHTYMALKAELADLDRRRKRPRMERSSSDHINNFNSSVTCRN